MFLVSAAAVLAVMVAAGLRGAEEPAAPAAAKVEDLAGAKVGKKLEVALGGGVKIALCGIPAGKFTMGSPAGEKGRYPEETQHDVTLTKAFWLGCTAGAAQGGGAHRERNARPRQQAAAGFWRRRVAALRAHASMLAPMVGRWSVMPQAAKAAEASALP